jgi:hypothetical protein
LELTLVRYGYIHPGKKLDKEMNIKYQKQNIKLNKLITEEKATQNKCTKQIANATQVLFSRAKELVQCHI